MFTRAAILGLSLLVAGAAFAAEQASRTPHPVIERAVQGTQCVADPDFMRRNHMDLLKHQRDDTVRRGIRSAGPSQAASSPPVGRREASWGRGSDAKFSLKECIACHANQKTMSVTKEESNFCVSCHTYAAVKLDCFECHTSKSGAVAQKGATK